MLGGTPTGDLNIPTWHIDYTSEIFTGICNNSGPVKERNDSKQVPVTVFVMCHDSASVTWWNTYYKPQLTDQLPQLRCH